MTLLYMLPARGVQLVIKKPHTHIRVDKRSHTHAPRDFPLLSPASHTGANTRSREGGPHYIIIIKNHPMVAIWPPIWLIWPLIWLICDCRIICSWCICWFDRCWGTNWAWPAWFGNPMGWPIGWPICGCWPPIWFMGGPMPPMGAPLPGPRFLGPLRNSSSRAAHLL